MDFQQVLKRTCLEEKENLLMALYPPSYDAEKGMVTKSAFKKNNTSVSRKAVFGVDEILEILYSQLNKPGREVQAYGCITVSEVKKAAEDSDVVYLEVTEDPIEGNASHAEIVAFDSKEKTFIRKDVPNPVAKKLCTSLRLHQVKV